jgi:hypothetical protein
LCKQQARGEKEKGEHSQPEEEEWRLVPGLVQEVFCFFVHDFQAA